MSIVTKTGDTGTTALMYNRRVSKCDPRVEACGEVDELNAALGVARANADAEVLRGRLLRIQKTLVLLMGELATDPQDLDRYVKSGGERVGATHTLELEGWLQEVEAKIPSFRDWAMPGANVSAAALDMARTVARRAERRVCALHDGGALSNPEVIVYLNRLSDFLWLCARCVEAPPGTGPRLV